METQSEALGIDGSTSLRELAGIIEIAPAYLSDIERGMRNPTERVLIQIAEVLDLDFEPLMREAGRIRESVHQYMLREELAGRIVQVMTDANLDREDLEQVLQMVVETARRRKGAESQQRVNS